MPIKKNLDMYLAALGLSCGMQDLLVGACELLVGQAQAPCIGSVKS